MQPDPHQPLRDDVRLLGNLLGEALRAQGGPALFESVERVRALSKQAREGERDAFEALEDLLQGLAVDDALPVARAFSHFLTLANIAEQHHRVRRRRDYLRDPDATPQPASLRDSFDRLLKAGVEPAVVHEAVGALHVELVLTAHPTEIVRRTLRQRLRRIAELLEIGDRGDLTEPERDDLTDSLRREITSAWKTDEVRQERPTPLDEVRWGLVAFEQTLWDAVPQHLRALDRELYRATGQGLPVDAAPVRFGSWMGGDRDGNPNVTPEVTQRACLMARWMAADLYLKEITELRSELSMRDGSAELCARAGTEYEPYRALLSEVCDRLRDTRSAIAEMFDGSPADRDAEARMYWDAAELAEPLHLCFRSLRETGAAIVAEGRLLDVLRRVSCFGLTLARLDLRQEAARHTEAFDALTQKLGLGSYAAWDESERQRFLLEHLEQGGRAIEAALDDPTYDPDVRDVLETFRMTARVRTGSLGAYVISMAYTPSDVLAVELL